MKSEAHSRLLWRAKVRLAGAVLPLVLAGCASVPGPNPRDPLEPFNREVSKFNESVDAAVLKPVATVYRQSVPPLVRTGVSNFFSNLADAWTFVNALLQFRLQVAEESFARFHVNTMFGIGGIFDVASELNIERHREDFGQTLGRWGVPAGPYIVLPFLGPSTLRDTVALPVDWKGDLVRNLPHGDERTALRALRAVDVRANLLRIGNVINEAALDKYSFTRDAYLQKRRADIFDFREQQDNEGAEPALEPQTPAAAPTPASGASAPSR